MTRPGVFSQVLLVVQKDLLIEWRARSRAFALGCFAITVLLLFSFAVGPDTATLREHASAYLWLAVLLSSTLLLARSFQVETEAGALETLLLAPIEPAALYYGKVIANTVQLIVLACVAVPAVLALFDGAIDGPIWALLLTVVLGTAGISAPGTLYAGLTARLHARQLLLPLLLFPLIVPCLLASVKATEFVLTPDAMNQRGAWLALLACFDLLYLSICGILFGRVVES